MAKIYTKKGDNGHTSTITFTGNKSDDIFEVLGDLDELQSWIGRIRLQVKDDFLKTIQMDLMDIGSVYGGYTGEIKITPISELENEIDKMTAELPKLKNFLITGGKLINADIDICRSVCRRLERHMVKFDIDSPHIKYINRLSDYLYTYNRIIMLLDNVEEETYSSKNR